MEKVDGTWVGRLIDIGGFEGNVTLTLRSNKGALEGVFDAAIDGQHRPTVIRGKLSGKQSGDKVALVLGLGQENSTVGIALEGGVLGTRSGELAVCGSYSVSTRQKSPLMGGVIAVRQPSAEPNEVLVRTVTAQVDGGAEITKSSATKSRKRTAATASSRTRRKS